MLANTEEYVLADMLYCIGLAGFNSCSLLKQLKVLSKKFKQFFSVCEEQIYWVSGHNIYSVACKRGAFSSTILMKTLSSETVSQPFFCLTCLPSRPQRNEP